MKLIYLDYAATTPVDSAVVKAMIPYFSKKFGNAGSLHFFGQEAVAALDESREKITKSIGANFREIIFTGSATEANNLALRGAVKGVRLFSCGMSRKRGELGLRQRRSRRAESQGRGLPLEQADGRFRQKTTEPPYRIIISEIEHESILETCRDLEKEGVEVVYLPINRDGFIDLKKLEKSLNENTVLVSIMYANNEIGTVQPLFEISKIIQDFKTRCKITNTYESTKKIFADSHKFVVSHRLPLFHTDAVQAFQFLDCDVNKLGVDLMTLSAHKIYGPKGAGLLYIRNLKPNIQNLKSIITGGGQEFGLRSSTENVPAIVGFAKAVELVSNSRKSENKRVRKLSDYFWRKIKKIYPKAKLNNSRGERLPNILNIYFPGQSARDLLIKFDLAGIAVSSGSACSARKPEPSYVLRACGLPLNRIKSSLRISFGKPTTKTEVDEVLKRIKKII